MRMAIFYLITLLMGSAFAQSPLQQIVAANIFSGKTETILLSSNHKALVVIFMSANCPSSNAHAESVKNLHERFKNFDFVVLHSNQDEPLELAKTYFAKLNLGMAVLEDTKAVYANILKAAKTPHATVLDAEGKILYQGGITNSNEPKRATEFYLQNALSDIENSKPVKVSEGRTLGCLINRGEKNVW